MAMPILAITRIAALAATLAATEGDPGSDSPAERLAAAARSGDAAEIRRLLDAGLSVDTPLRYNTTALHPACDRGHVDVVKLLLDRGAKTEVTDSFYGSTPLVWALNPAMGPFTERHLEIVDLLLSKGAKGREWVLSTGASRGDARLVRAAFDEAAMPGPYDLALALAQAKGDEVAAMLKAAGAKPMPEPSFVVEPAQLQAYAGKYAGDARRGIQKLQLEVEGKHLVLRAEGVEAALSLGALDARTFWTQGPPSALITLDVVGPEVRGLTLRAGGGPARYLARVRPEETP